MARAFTFNRLPGYSEGDNAVSLARAKAFLKEKFVHNCNLLFTPDLRKLLPKLRFDLWRMQAGSAPILVQHLQHEALVCAGILVSSITATRIVLTIQTYLTDRLH